MKYRGVLREYAALWEMLLRVGDAFAVVVSGWLASLIYLGGAPRTPGFALGMELAVLLCLVLFPSFGLYRTWRGSSLGEEVQKLTLAWMLTLGALTFLAFVSKTGHDYSRGWFLIWLAVGWALLVMGRIFLRSILRTLRVKGFNQRRVVVVGSPEKATQLAARLEAAPWAGLTVAGIFPAEPAKPEPTDSARGPETPFEADDEFAELVALVKREKVDQVWIAVPLRDEATIHRVQCAMRHQTVDVRYAPDVSGFQLLNHSISEVAGLPVINLSSSGMNAVDRLVKAVEDRVLAALILALIAPLMLLIALGVKLSSPGPVLFRQRRLGLGGEEITVFKFRSMVVHKESTGRVTQASKGDPRITPFGAFLRRTSLDELPQFFNVLTGAMSIVGPRPHALEHNEQYKVLVDRYMARHKIKPGITGWAQINGYRGETDTLEKMQKRVEHDLHYIETWSLWLDLKIIAVTIVKGFVHRNAY